MMPSETSLAMETCRLLVTFIGQSDEITVGRHTVRTSRTDIGCSHIRKLHALHEINLFQRIVERDCHRCSRRAYVLEGSRRRKSGSLFQLCHQLPAVKCVQKIDVSRLSVQNFKPEVPPSS